MTAPLGIGYTELKPAHGLKIFGKPELSEYETLRLVFFAIAVLFIIFSLLSLVRYQALSPRDATIRGDVLSAPAISQGW